MTLSPKQVHWVDKVIDKLIWSREAGEGDGNKRRLRSNPTQSWKKQQANYHLVTPSYAQIPPAACRLSRKKLKYRQRLNQFAEIGDCIILSIEDDKMPFFEDLRSGPLAKFIKLAAADCEMTPSQADEYSSSLFIHCF